MFKASTRALWALAVVCCLALSLCPACVADAGGEHTEHVGEAQEALACGVRGVCPVGQACDWSDNTCRPICGGTTGATCDDRDPCTVDSCNHGLCYYYALDCNDGNECTIDSCSSSMGGCMHENAGNGVTCESGTGHCMISEPTCCGELQGVTCAMIPDPAQCLAACNLNPSVCTVTCSDTCPAGTFPVPADGVCVPCSLVPNPPPAYCS